MKMFRAVLISLPDITTNITHRFPKTDQVVATKQNLHSLEAEGRVAICKDTTHYPLVCDFASLARMRLEYTHNEQCKYNMAATI